MEQAAREAEIAVDFVAGKTTLECDCVALAKELLVQRLGNRWLTKVAIMTSLKRIVVGDTGNRFVSCRNYPCCRF